MSSGVRVKLTLPSINDCWFTFSNTDTFSQVHSFIQSEDPMITSVTSEYGPEVPLSTILATQGQAKLRINGAEVTISGADTEVSQKKATPLMPFLNHLYAKKPSSKDELEEAVMAALDHMGEEASAKIEKINAQLANLRDRIGVLETAKNRLERKVDRRITFFGLAGLSYMSAQWGMFYYTIYMVDWLGWDLMEPITFSVGQAGFLAGVWYYMRAKTPNTFLGMADRYRAKKMKKLARKFNLDLDLYERLKRDHGELLVQREKLVKRTVKGGPLAD